MAKNRINKNKKKKLLGMDTSESTLSNMPQAMDTSESGHPKSNAPPRFGKVKKGRPMKRSKNVRKMKAREKAISTSEKGVEKVLKYENKTVRTISAKKLYH